MTRPIVELKGVYKAFDDNQVLDSLDLSIEPGEIITIIGGSGAGKTVLLKLILGLIKPEAGRILIEGQDIVPLKEGELLKVRKKMGMVFQGSALFDSLSVGENVAFSLREHTRLSEAEVRDRVLECLGLVGLEGIEGKDPAELSGGMRKRVGIARAIALVPKILLYDEPTTGLDPSNVEKITELILDLNGKLNVTSMVVTHDLKSAFKISDRLALLHQGRIAFVGTHDEVEGSESPLVKNFIAGHMV